MFQSMLYKAPQGICGFYLEEVRQSLNLSQNIFFSEDVAKHCAPDFIGIEVIFGNKYKIFPKTTSAKFSPVFIKNIRTASNPASTN